MTEIKKFSKLLSLKIARREGKRMTKQDRYVSDVSYKEFTPLQKRKFKQHILIENSFTRISTIAGNCGDTDTLSIHRKRVLLITGQLSKTCVLLDQLEKIK